MPNTTRRKTRRRRRRKARPVRRLLVLLAALALAAAAFMVENWGGQGGIPTWSQLYTALGVPMDGPDAGLLAANDTTVTVLDVGQGDSVLIGQDGEYCLIDTGTADTRQSLVRDLRLAGVRDLRYLILTHPHADHTGGATAVLEGLSVQELILPVWRPETEGESPWPDAIPQVAAGADTTVTETAEGDCFPLGTGTLYILQGGSDWMQSAEDVNNGSLCLLFQAGDFRYLATGDAEAESEQALVDRYGSSLQAVLYKAGHHGSSTSSSEALLSVVRPQAAVISCGLDNDYGHPHRETLDRLEAVGAEIYRTDTMGTITFTCADGVLQADTGEGSLEAAA